MVGFDGGSPAAFFKSGNGFGSRQSPLTAAQVEGEWVFAALAIDDGVRFYAAVHGQPLGAATTGGANPYEHRACPVVIGGSVDESGNFCGLSGLEQICAGTFDQMRVFDRALSDDEINAIFTFDPDP